jgi:flagellar biosynthesis chaperone FliJ
MNAYIELLKTMNMHLNRLNHPEGALLQALARLSEDQVKEAQKQLDDMVDTIDGIAEQLGEWKPTPEDVRGM